MECRDLEVLGWAEKNQLFSVKNLSGSPLLMNEKPEENKALDLSALDFGPSWARQGEGKPQKKYSGGERSERRRDGGGAKRRDGGRPQREPREERKFEGKRGGNNDRRRPQRPQPVAATANVAADVMPVEEGIDNLSKEITAAGRTYSVFELARVILSARERYKVVFRKEENGPELLQCKQDGAVFLTKAECLAHFRKAEWQKEIYSSEVIEVDAPSGNFPSVAKCGFSGESFGPPNHHAYASKVAAAHQAGFTNMDLERYKSRIIVEKGEDAVNAWLESMKKQTQYSLVSTAEVAEGEEPAAAVVIGDEQAMLAHFEAELFASTYRSTHRADVDSQIPGKLLSPGLLTLLKETIADQRRYPGKLAPFLCRQLSGRHLAVFKWQGKLHCGPSRPHAVAEDVKLAERPDALNKWVSANPAAGVDKLWEALLPADVTDEAKVEWFHALHWMINQGHIVLTSEGLVFSATYTKPAEPKKVKKAKSAAKAEPKSDAAE